MKEIQIGNKKIGFNEKPYFIADIAANHDGDLNRAYKLIELAKEAGADAAKFQNFKAKKIVSNKGFDSLNGQMSHQASWEKSVVEVYEDASVPDDWTEKFKHKCNDIGIEYFTSPYDFESVDLVDPFVNVYKIGSGDITWLDIIEYIAKKNKPVFIATGASDMNDVLRAMNLLQSYTDDIVLMQCNTNYTANPQNYNFINLNVLKTFKQYFPNVILGLSDHTHGHATVLGAIALGTRVIEKHFTDDNNRVGPDHKFAMNPIAWRDMVDRSMELFNALGDGVKRIEKNEEESVIVQRRSLRYNKDLYKNTIITKNDIIALRPIKDGNIEPYRINEIVGRTLNKKVLKDDAINFEDFII
ncbi:MAG: N-acetylneuraminate synthase family protein [Flavobacteriaceae bacterium]|nr:N-acetylneuraminate synthase family protein [Flavobacteriaceae bacterium]